MSRLSLPPGDYLDLLHAIQKTGNEVNPDMRGYYPHRWSGPESGAWIVWFGACGPTCILVHASSLLEAWELAIGFCETKGWKGLVSSDPIQDEWFSQEDMDEAMQDHPDDWEDYLGVQLDGSSGLYVTSDWGAFGPVPQDTLFQVFPPEMEEEA